MKYPNKLNYQKQKGAIIIVCLFVLLAVMSLGVFGMRNITLSERASGNTLEKQRSLQAAESGLRYAEWWLSLNNTGEFVNCANTTNGNDISLMRVCNNPLDNPSSLPWTGYTVYSPEKMAINTNGGLTDAGDINYTNPPQLYINYLGKNRRGDFFQISAAGFGGQESTVSILQSTFTFSLNSINLGGL